MRAQSDNIKFYDDFMVIVTTGEMATRNHCHYAMELVVGLDSPFIINQTPSKSTRARAVLIRSNTAHCISMGKGLSVSVLIEPQSELGGDLAMAFNRSAHVVLGENATKELIAYFSRYLKHHYDAGEIASSLSEIICNGKKESACPQLERIRNILFIINRDEENSSSDFKRLVETSGLSASRLMHYFKEQTGLTIRKYIKWRRVLRAIKFISQGYKIKDASSKSRFSDAAHFNRTFVSAFGANPSKVFGKLER